MLNDLLLLSGNDIPFIAAQVNIHQPTIKEIAYIGEEAFFTGCQLLNFSKDILNEEDKSNLEQLSNFEVLMSIINDKNTAIKKQKVCLVMVLTLIFPTYQVKLSQNEILFLQDNQVVGKLTKDNFEEFKEIIHEAYHLSYPLIFTMENDIYVHIYSIGIVGILVFIISATLSLLVYRKSGSYNNEEEFQ